MRSLIVPPESVYAGFTLYEDGSMTIVGHDGVKFKWYSEPNRNTVYWFSKIELGGDFALSYPVPSYAEPLIRVWLAEMALEDAVGVV